MYFDQRGAVPLLLALCAAALLAFLVLLSIVPLKDGLLNSLFPKTNSYAATNFVSNFDGLPAAPQPFLDSPQSADWDVAVHSRDIKNWLQLTPFEAQHGPDCAPPIDAMGMLVTHHNDGSYHSAVFKCKDHLMTTIRAGLHNAPDEATSQPGENDGYGVIYLTPNQLADFNTGEVVISWEMATLRTSTRDWVDVWITPFEDNLQLPLYDWLPDLNGEPKRAIHINMNQFNGLTTFGGELFSNYEPIGVEECWWCTLEDKMTTSPQKRSKFELRLSKTHLKFSMPAGQIDVTGAPINGGQELVWIDRTFDAPLDWGSGVVQFGHHSYNPSKDCTYNPATPYKTCYANTWHWDAFSISNAKPFTLIKGNRRFVAKGIGTDTTDVVSFPQPAPANSFLRFSAIGVVEYSLNNGQTYAIAPLQRASRSIDGVRGLGTANNYFVSIPQGTQSVKFRLSGEGWYTGFPLMAKDFSIWSLSSPVTASVNPTSLPSQLPSSSPIPSVKPGDIDGNGKVDIFDYNSLLSNFGKTGTNIPGDYDKNGKVDIFDFNYLLTNFGK
jgi:hypothetical protein